MEILCTNKQTKKRTTKMLSPKFILIVRMYTLKIKKAKVRGHSSRCLDVRAVVDQRATKI